MQKQKQKTKVRFLLSLAAVTWVALFIGLAMFRHASVTAATGTNEQLNYQARLLNSQGAVVPDGLYNIRFRIYQDGDGVLGGGDETLAWTEARTGASRVTVKNGYFSIYLGSVTPFSGSVDWNQDTLWLSVDIGGTSGTPSYDGEMSPFTRLSSSPYALNSAALGGLTSDNFVQLGQGEQTDASANASIHINDTGGGNLLHLLSGSVDRFTVSNTGTIAAATAADTINGIIINAGAISGVAGFAQDSGNFDASASSGSFATSSGAVSLNGDTTVATGNTLSVTDGLTTLGGGLAVSSGTTTLNTFGGVAGLLETDSSGVLTVATAGTDYEVPLTFSNGLTRTSNNVTLGGTLTGATNIALGGNDFGFSGTGRVGIGTPTPQQALHLQGAAANFRIGNSTETDSGIEFVDSDAPGSQNATIQYGAGDNLLKFSNAGTLGLQVTSAGNVSVRPGHSTAIEFNNSFDLANIVLGEGAVSGGNTGTLSLFHYRDSLLFPANKLLGLARAGTTQQADVVASSVGDKIALYGSVLTDRYGLGVQTSRLVSYVPSGAAFSVRQSQTSGQASGGTDAITLFANGDLTATGNITANGTVDYTAAAADNDSLVCHNSSGQLATCSNAVLTGTAFMQGGNSFSAQAVLGTNDANSLAFETNSTTRAILDTSGNLAFQQASTISTSTGALTLQPSAGSNLNVNLSGTGDLAVNTDQLYVDTSADRVGIGTTAPGYQLDLRGAGTPSQLHFSQNTTDSGGYITSAGSNNFFFSGGSAWSGANWVAKDASAGIIGTTAGGVSIFADTGLIAGNAYTPSVRLTVTSTGNIGIGDFTPDAKLEVLSTTEQLRLTHTDNTVDSRFTVDASGNLTINNTGTKTVIADDLQITGNDLLDSTATTRLTLGATNAFTGAISSTGSLTVTSGGANITGGLNNNSGGITNTGSLAGVTTISASGLFTSSGSINLTGSAVYQNDGASGISLSCGGDQFIDQATVSGGIITSTSGCANDSTFSDSRLKENVVSLSDGVLTAIRDVNVVNFDYICTDAIFYQNGGTYSCNETKLQTGVIAQELSSIFPDLVILGADGFYRVDYDGLSAYNLKAVQELAQYIDSNGDADFGSISVNGTEVVSSSGVIQNLNGLTVVSGGATIGGGTINLNVGGLLRNTNINTGASTGTVSIGGGLSPLSINSTAFDVSTGGAVSGVSTLSASGNINTSGGGYQTAGTTRLSNGGALQNITGLTVISGGATISGTTSINAGALLTNTSINTGSSTGTVTIGGGLANFVVNSSAFDVTSSGNVSTPGNVEVGALGTFVHNGNSGITLLCSGNQGIDGVNIRGGIVTSSGCRSFGLSDERLKDNVIGLSDDVLQKITDINTVNFDFDCSNQIFSQNGGTYNCDTENQTGVIAQQLAQVFPELVYQGEDGYYRVRYDALNIYTLKAVTQLAQAINIENNRIVLNTASRTGLTILGNSGAELFAIDEEGNATFNGTITAEGSLNQAQVLAAIDQQLANAFGAGLEIGGYSAFNANVDFNELVNFANDVVFAQDVIFRGRPMFNNDTGGFATIEQGDQEVRVEFEHPFVDDPVVNISNIDGQFMPYSYKDLDETGFTIVVQLPAVQDVQFSWTALAIDNALTQLSGQDSLDN